MKFQDASIQEIDKIMNEAWQAFIIYRKTTLKQRAGLMRAIAGEIEAVGDILIHTAMRETILSAVTTSRMFRFSMTALEKLVCWLWHSS